ncbi:MAG: hypothetical protein ACRDPZ_14835 [Gaiellaceae bacterium]
MKARYAVLVAIAAAVTVTSVGAAAPEAAKQRVTITAGGAWNSTSFGKFVLTPLRAGALKPDSGTETATWTTRDVTRDGQKVGISISVTTLEGRRGTLVIRQRVEGVGAGNGYEVAIGTWKVVRGTGQYAQVTGGGGAGWATAARTRTWSESQEGFLTVP